MTRFDPDLDMTARPRPIAPGDVGLYQRLVVNPLLAVLALLGVWTLLWNSLEIRNVYLFLASLFAGFVSLLLIQYHCLDCGRTDFILRSRRHACQAVVHRSMAEEEPFFPPSVGSQVKAWGILFVTTLLVLAIVFAPGP